MGLCPLHSKLRLSSAGQTLAEQLRHPVVKSPEAMGMFYLPQRWTSPTPSSPTFVGPFSLWLLWKWWYFLGFYFWHLSSTYSLKSVTQISLKRPSISYCPLDVLARYHRDISTQPLPKPDLCFPALAHPRVLLPCVSFLSKGNFHYHPLIVKPVMLKLRLAFLSLLSHMFNCWWRPSHSTALLFLKILPFHPHSLVSTFPAWIDPTVS